MNTRPGKHEAIVHSFDVFDTSLIRKVAAPTDIFRVLGEVVARSIRITNQSEFIEDFVSARILAERNARLNREETTLDQIWTNLRLLMPEVPSIFGPQDELGVERKLLVPNAIVAQQISSLRLKGMRIIFASDTYLPEEFVREQLLRYGLTREGDGIYVSSTAGVAKWTGGLFKIILSREGIPAKDIYHFGDDPHSDVAMPERLGISAALWSGSKFNTWERALLSKDPECRTAASLLAGSMRAFRLSTAFESKCSSDQLAATLLGPALMVWAAWVLGAAKRDGIRRLYFVSRDAYLLCEAARVVAPLFGNIECRHLKISRQSISLPATEEISQSGMPWLCRAWEPKHLDFLLLKLGLSWSEVKEHFSSLANSHGKFKRLNTPRDWDEFWSVIQKAPIVDLLRENIATKRSSTLAYLRAEGLFDEVPAGVVDIGWYSMTQSLLKKLLAIGGSPSIIRGYYFALLSDRLAPRDTGKVTALFYDQAPDHREISPHYEAFNKRINILEHLFGLAPHGSVREYEASGSTVEPVYLAESQFHIEFVNKIKSTIKAFCEENHEDVLRYSDNTVARQILNSLFSAWCIQPNRVALAGLEHVTAAEGPDNALVEPLFSRWRLIDAAKTIVPWRLRDYLKIKLSPPVWREAAFYTSGPVARSVLRLSDRLRHLNGRASASYGPPFDGHK